MLSCLSIKQQEILYHFCSAFVLGTLLLAVSFSVALNGTCVKVFLIGKILKKWICCVKPVCKHIMSTAKWWQNMLKNLFRITKITYGWIIWCSTTKICQNVESIASSVVTVCLDALIGWLIRVVLFIFPSIFEIDHHLIYWNILEWVESSLKLMY